MTPFLPALCLAATALATPQVCPPYVAIPGEYYNSTGCAVTEPGALPPGRMQTIAEDVRWVGLTCVSESYWIPDGAEWTPETIPFMGWFEVYQGSTAGPCAQHVEPPAIAPEPPVVPRDPPIVAQVPEPPSIPVVGFVLLVVGGWLTRKGARR